MNTCPKFCFQIGLFTRWQHVITLLVSLWFISYNANIICSTSYWWGPQRCRTNQSINDKNYKNWGRYIITNWKLRKMWELTYGVDFFKYNIKTLRISFNLEIMFYGFLRQNKTHLGKFKKRWFGPFRVQYCLPNNIVLFVSINNFEPNPITRRNLGFCN